MQPTVTCCREKCPLLACMSILTAGHAMSWGSNPRVVRPKHSLLLRREQVNEQWLTERILYHMEVAKEHLMRRRRVGADDEFVQTAILILPDGREQELVLAFYDCCEQKACMRELAAACLELDASALILRARALLLTTDPLHTELDIDEAYT